jgi:DnaJ-class molecular chaperone
MEESKMSNSPIDYKKCNGSGTNRAGKCGACAGQGKVTLSSDENGKLIVTPFIAPTAKVQK